MGNFGIRLQEAKEIHEKVDKWRSRFDSLRGNRANFCRKYGIDDTQLARWLSGKHAPRKDMVDKIEEHLVEEGC